MAEEKKIEEKAKQQFPIGSIIFLLAYIGIVIYIKGRIPDANDLISIITDLYKQYGYYIIFSAGILESMFFIGFYVPGSAVILLGAVIARTGVVSLPLIILLGTLGLLIGYSINYALGRYGWYQTLTRFSLEKGLVTAKQKLEKYGKLAIFFGYLSPNSGAFLSTTCGIVRMPFKKFFLLSLLSQLLWSVVWGITAYTIGYTFVELFLRYFAFVIWGVILLWLLHRALKGKLFKWL